MAYTEEQKAYHREYYLKRRQKIIDFLGGACAECGATESLEFDHVVREQKAFDIKDNLTLGSVLDEVSKCQLLCKPCHARKTALELQGFTHGTLYGWMKKKCVCPSCLTEKWLWHDARNEGRRKPDGRGPYGRRRQS